MTLRDDLMQWSFHRDEQKKNDAALRKLQELEAQIAALRAQSAASASPALPQTAVPQRRPTGTFCDICGNETDARDQTIRCLRCGKVACSRNNGPWSDELQIRQVCGQPDYGLCAHCFDAFKQWCQRTNRYYAVRLAQTLIAEWRREW